MIKKLFVTFCIATINLLATQASAIELVIGEKRVSPGIIFIFEGAIKDSVMPMLMHIPEKETDVHIEARVNWAEKLAPKGAPAGGFIAYLHITAKVTNQKTGLSTFVDLLPHINLIDNFHYARNISLPGAISDLYKIEFNVLAPTDIDLALHKDWINRYGEVLLNNTVFKYKDVNFKEVAEASRR